MADKTTGELEAVKVEELPAAPDIYDDFKMPGELHGSAVHVTGAQMKQYAVASVQPLADAADADAVTAKNAATSAENAKTAAQSALAGVQAALNNLPAGDTLIVNDLTTGGASAALSAEMGKTLGQRPNPNLLHNWCFANAVNQRGAATYTEIGYAVDRWQIVTANTSLAVGTAGLTLTHSGSGGNLGVVRQVLERPADLYGEIVTVSILLSDGSFAHRTGRIPAEPPTQDTVVALATLDESGANGRYFALFEAANGDLRGQIRVPFGGEMTVVAVKLELGSTQTLAHQDASGNWVLNEIPDYGEELAKCQRYQSVYPTTAAGQYWLATAQSATQAKIFVQLPDTLRSVPALTFDTEALALTDNTSIYPITAVSVFAKSGNVITLNLTTSGLTAGKTYTLRASAATKIIFDANL